VREAEAVTGIPVSLECDEDGYPTSQTLEAIRTWPIETLLDCERLFDAVQPLWRWPQHFQRDRRRHRTPGSTLARYWHVSTGGWSGHEDIIAALEANEVFWFICWVSSARGGHYVFETRAPR
jgi:hypothetical protein